MSEVYDTVREEAVLAERVRLDRFCEDQKRALRGLLKKLPGDEWMVRAPVEAHIRIIEFFQEEVWR